LKYSRTSRHVSVWNRHVTAENVHEENVVDIPVDDSANPLILFARQGFDSLVLPFECRSESIAQYPPALDLLSGESFDRFEGHQAFPIAALSMGGGRAARQDRRNND
jgi:hypothetical protein